MGKERVRYGSDVRRALRLVKRPVVESERAERLLQCYEVMSETGREGLEELVASVCNQFAAPFGELQALDLVGALLECGYLQDWEKERD